MSMVDALVNVAVPDQVINHGLSSVRATLDMKTGKVSELVITTATDSEVVPFYRIVRLLTPDFIEELVQRAAGVENNE